MRISTPLKLFAWIGIAAISVQLNAVPLDYLLFRLNQGQIVRTQCEHKMPHCNGHCYLVKQITKAGNSTNDNKIERFAQLDGHFLPLPENNLTVYAPSRLERAVFVKDHILTGWPLRLFQPPRIADDAVA